MFTDWQLMVAARYTRAGAGDQLTSFTSAISGAGLVLGVTILTIVLSVMNGFDRELRERVLGVMPHGVVYLAGGVSDAASLGVLLAHIKSHPEVLAAAPIREGSGLIVAAGQLHGVSIVGIDPDQERGVSILDDFYISGAFEDLGGFRVAVGSRIAAALGLRVGDRVTWVSPDVRISLAGPLPVTRRLTVSGIFRSGSDADQTQIYVAITDLQKLQKGSGVEGFRILTRDLFQAPQVLQDLVLSSEQRLFGSSWLRRHGNLHDAIAMQKRTMFLMLMLLVAVAAFNVVSNLVMVVKEKAGDIAILRTMGAPAMSIRRIFVLHGLLVGSVGILVGLMVGVLLSLVIGDLVAAVDRSLGLGLMDEYFIQYLPVDIRIGDLLLIGSVSFAICLVATLYPASRAAASHPVEALQYEA
jgi:lipoprotein-releasing system permease protein